MTVLQYLRELVRRRRIDAEVDDELQFHVDMAARAHEQAGLSAAEARVAALRELGGVTQVKEAVHDLRRGWPDLLAQDVRYGVRRLFREPVFAVASILILAVGIATCTAMFSIVQAVLLRSLGIEDPDRVVMLWTRHPQRHAVGELSYESYRHLRSQSRSLSDIAIVGSVNWPGTMTAGSAEPVDVPAGVVSAAFFDVLGARPLLGRTFRDQDDQPSAPRVMVLSHATWTQHFESDPNVIGRRVTMREEAASEPFEIVGVMPQEFFFPNGVGYWTPAAPRLDKIARRAGGPIEPFFKDLNVFYGLGRMTSGSTLDSVATESALLLNRITETPQQPGSAPTVVATPLLDHVFGRTGRALWLLMAAVVVILLVTCTNVAGLVFAREASRMREMAVRAAIGAGRNTLIRQVMVESTVMAFVAAVLGVMLAVLTLDTLIALSPPDIPRIQSTALDGRVLLFALVATIATTLLVGVLPAIHASRASLVRGLNSGGHAVGHEVSHGRIRRALVAAQVATAMVLVIVAALCVNSFSRLTRLDLGFDPTNVLTFEIGGMGDAGFQSRAHRFDAIEAILERFQNLPDVVATGAIYQRPFEHGSIGLDASFVLDGQVDTQESRAQNPILNHEAVTPGYFATMRIRLVRGRLFNGRDHERAPAVVIVSEAMANRVWPGEDPIGKRLRTANDVTADGRANPWLTVVGVVATARYREIDTPRLELYVPFRQAASNVNHVTIRTATEPILLAPALASALSAFNPALTLDGITTMDGIISRTRAPWRFTMLMFSMFGTLSLTLVGIGLFALVAYEVTQRSTEIALRMALGATHGAVLRLMIRQGVLPAAIGLILGLLAALTLTRTLANQLFDVSPTDAMTFACGSMLLMCVVLAASYAAARRATLIAPQTALKDA